MTTTIYGGNFEAIAIDELIMFLEANTDFEDWEDLHHEVFNMVPCFIYTADAIKELDTFGSWEAIGEVKDYELSNFGEVYTDLSDPVAVANMLLYIVGEDIIYSLDVDEIVCELVDENDATPEEINETLVEMLKTA